MRDVTIVTMDRVWRGVVSDVSITHLRNLLAHRARQIPAAREQDDAGSLLAAGALDLARSELAQQGAEEHTPRPRPDDEWDGWAHVHAALSLPEVVLALPSVITRDDTAVLQEVQAQVA